MPNEFTQQVIQSVKHHFVTLSCQQFISDDRPPNTLVFSGFVIEILNEWFYITAGHILEKIQLAKNTGSTFDKWRFGDDFAGNPFNGAAVPFEFIDENWLALNDQDTGIDYAVAHIHHFYRRQLEAGGVKAIPKNAWGNYTTGAEHWALVGVPSESVSYDSQRIITARILLVPLESAEEPTEAGARAANQFYAKPAEGSENYYKNPDGFSGAPVFALMHQNKNLGYTVIGIQSAWYKSCGTLAICPFISFAEAIENILIEAKIPFPPPIEN